VSAPAFPRFKLVGDGALLIEFANAYEEAAHARILAFDAAFAAKPRAGVAECVPAYAAALITYDPLVIAPEEVIGHARALLAVRPGPVRHPASHRIRVCYEPSFAPDLPELAERLGLEPQAIVAQHLAALYRVVAFGFAPGYAYLHGTPEALRQPRKPSAVRDVPAGSVIIAGAQCLVTTLTMPTGWWVIGASPEQMLPLDRDPPVRFALGDQVRFARIDEAELLTARAGAA
jgi:inhibitor of KinA